MENKQATGDSERRKEEAAIKANAVSVVVCKRENTARVNSAEGGISIFSSFRLVFFGGGESRMRVR